MATPRTRLDLLLVARGLAESRSRAEALVLSGRVKVKGVERPKPGTPLLEDAELTVEGPEHPWVSRGGVKLAAGLDAFGIDPSGRVCLDVGASTGGFTDVLLTRGAVRVWAIDVGHGQLHAKLRFDPRVVLREGVNARLLTRDDVPEPCSLLVADVSFISLRLILPAVVPLLDPAAEALLLVKPQFESERGEVGKGGIVRDPDVRTRALERVVGVAVALGLVHVGTVPSPITGADGNVELLAAFRRDAPPRGSD